MSTPPFDPRALCALAFDVFGTVVDWRSSIVREGQMLCAARDLQVDWPAFADAWRAGYAPAMDRTRGAGNAWADIDTLHRQILDELVPRFGLQSLDESELVHLNQVWHRLMPWPDAVSGLNRLRGRFVISTLSNGNVSLLVDMAKNAGLPWDCVLSGELIRKYKPDPEVYRMAARLLGCAPGELMLVAAHPSDLRAAQACGLRTAYVHRALEFGAGAPPMSPHPAGFDLVAADFLDLARQLAA
jgi:2-haloacid dehalogenase